MGCVGVRIPTIATTYTDRSRPPVPIDHDHPFRGIATRLRTVYDASRRVMAVMSVWGGLVKGGREAVRARAGALGPRP